MGPRFKFLGFFLLGFLTAGSWLQAQQQTGQNSEGLEMIAQRMKSLSHSLSHMPEPPVMNQKIQLPDMSWLPVKFSGPSNSQNLLTKQQKES